MIAFIEKHSHVISKNIIERNLDILFGPLDFIITNHELSKKFQHYVHGLSFEKKQNWLREKIHQEQGESKLSDLTSKLRDFSVEFHWIFREILLFKKLAAIS